MKQRNSVFRNRFFVALTIFFVLTCFVTTSSWAAKKVKIFSNNGKQLVKQLNAKKNIDPAALGDVFGLSGDDAFTVVRQRTDFNGVTHKRFRQAYKGIPVWGMETVVSIGAGKKALRMNGNVILEIGPDVGGLASLDPKGALEKVKQDHMKKKAGANWFFENETSAAYIYIHKNGKAYLCYVVSFFADNETGDPSRYVHFIDAKTGRELHKYNRLNDADGTGPGGNLKIGQYEYGTDFPAFGVTQSGSTCTMDTTDVKTVNLNHGTSGTTAYSYTCPRNTVKEINGAYSPLNDAQYFGQVVYDMYQAWIGQPVLTFQLMMRVHYSTNYENAFWNGSSMTFGDGYTTFYPLVSLDVSAHEVAHGFTDQNSDLIYSGESGGINEAYSDMAGEAAENYSRGSNDWLMGYDIFKDPTGALRYMHDPPLDGISIDHIDDYYSGMDVHYSSGIYNKVFYVLATSTGWTTRMAFEVFTKANTDYWTPSTGFQQGAEDAMQSAIDFGYNCQDVVDAFAVVGITLICPGPPTADFTATPLTGGYPLTVNFTDASSGATSWSWNFGDSGTSTDENPVHVYTAMGVYTVSLTATNSSGSDTVTKTDYITVTLPGPPVADFVADATDVVQWQPVNFTDLTTENPTSWDWTFEGGTPATSTAQNPTVTWDTVGTYTVSLTATNPQGTDSETKTGYIIVSDKPYCDSQGNNYSYEWIGRVQVDDLDNPSGAAGYTDFTSITEPLDAGATVNVTLTPEFASTIYTEYWKIYIDYNGDHDFEDAGEEVFSAVGTTPVSGSFTVPSGLNITTRMRVSMKWNAAQTPCETFSYGEVEDYTVAISTGVGQPPVADFSADNTTVNEGDTVNFTDLTTNNPDTWDWVFDGGTPGTSTAQNPSVVYNTAGTYNVSLTATNAYGTDTETKTAYITVLPPNEDPIADFTFSTNYLDVDFTDASYDNDGTIVSWAWDFGDSGSSTLQNPSYSYAAAGTYAVTLTVTDDDGATGFVTKNVTVTAPPTVDMFVQDITQTIIRQGSKYKSNAVITIWDVNSAPVANATVYITWGGVVSGSASGVTAANGTVSFTSAKLKSTGPFVITVSDVTHATLPYNPALNVETSDSQSY